jgi:hypothetical protein
MKSFLLFPIALLAMIAIMVYAWWPESKKA